MPDDKPPQDPPGPGNERPSAAKPEDKPAGKPDDKAAEKADNAADKPDEKPQEKASTPPQNAERDAAMWNLMSKSPGLSQLKMGEFVAEGITPLFGQTINVFQGDFAVEGDFNAGGGKQRPSRRQNRVLLETRVLDDATASFVEPPDFRDEVAVLADRNLVVLAGPDGTGKRTRALKMLRTVLADDETVESEVVCELTGPVLGNLAWRVPGERTGFVVFDEQNRDGKYSASKVTDDWLKRTSDKLGLANSFLVVVTGPVDGSLAGASSRTEYVLDELLLPDQMRIFTKRLEDTVPSVAAELLAKLEQTELAEVLEQRENPAFAVRAAMTVIDGHRHGVDVTESVAKLSDPAGSVREWLGREPDSTDLSLVLATAVLEKASYLKIADAAVSLRKRLHSGSGAPMTLQFTQRLVRENSWIRQVPPDDGHDAPSLRFRHPRIRAAVLSLVWLRYDGAREKVLEWLKELAEHTDVEVRAGAAQAVGILAQNDFEHGVHEYLLPWSTTDSRYLRQTAAQGLNVAGVLGHARAVWSVLEEWAQAAHAKNTENVCTTAALAAGGPLGIDNPRRALGVLRDFVTCEDKWELLGPVAESARALLGAQLGAQVLEALLEWTDDADGEALSKALAVFTFVVRAESDDEWPTLLRTADRNQEAISLLWSRSFGNGVVRPLAMSALETWVRRVDEAPGALRVVQGLVADIADESPADKRRVFRALRLWAMDRYAPSDAAAELHDKLMDIEEEVS